jgi:hypothetical protein
MYNLIQHVNRDALEHRSLKTALSEITGQRCREPDFREQVTIGQKKRVYE